MIKIKKRLLGFIMLVVLLLGVESPQAMEMNQPKRKHNQVGEKMPKIILSRLDGQFFSSAKLRDKVVIIAFWATWHPPCRSEIPAYIELYQKYKERNLEIIGIALDKNIKVLKEFVKDMQINYPIVMGNKTIEQAFGGIEAIPTTFLVDKRGRIRFRFVGYTPKEVFEEKIKRLLRE